MSTYKLFPFLFVLLLPLVGLEAKAEGQRFAIDSMPVQDEPDKLAKMEQVVSKGPHYKNKNAAGRLAVFNRNAPSATTNTKAELTGPAYKNRKPTADTAAAKKASFSRQAKITGPRYKNRRAKAHLPRY